MRVFFVISLLINLILIAVLAFFSPKVLSLKSSVDGLLNAFVERRVDALQASRLKAADVVFIGDSITHEGMWSEYFPHLVVANRGVSRDTTVDLLKRLDSILELKAKTVFLMIGINDLNRGHTIQDTKANLDKILATIKASLPDSNVYIQSILPTNDNWIIDVSQSDIVSLNRFLKSKSDDYGFEYLEVDTIFTDASGRLSNAYSNDGIHLSGNAYKKWVSLIDEQAHLSPSK